MVEEVLNPIIAVVCIVFLKSGKRFLPTMFTAWIIVRELTLTYNSLV